MTWSKRTAGAEASSGSAFLRGSSSPGCTASTPDTRPAQATALIERDYERGKLDKLDNYLEHVVIQRDDVALAMLPRLTSIAALSMR